jgi:hypothetical protein
VVAGVPAWVANDVGDITEVAAGTGISVASGTGPIPTVSIDTAITADLTTAQTLTNKTLTSPVLTTPTISTIDAKGDLLVGTADNTIGRLPVGTNDYVLVAASGETTGLKWAAPAGGGKVLQVVSTIKTDTFSLSSTTTLTDITGLSVSITPSSINSKIFITAHVGVYDTSVGSGFGFALLRGATKIAAGSTAGNRNLVIVGGLHDANNGAPVAFSFLDSPATTSSTTYKIQLYNNNATGYVNRTSEDSDTASYPRGSSTITVWEIGA